MNRLQFEDETNLRRYLLGSLSEKSLEEIEDTLMTDHDAPLRLSLAEADLIEDFVEGSLSRQENDQFETYFLCTRQRRSQLAFARALREYVDRHAPPSPEGLWPRFFNWFLAPFLNPVPAFATALTAALLVAVVGGTWSTMTWLHYQGQLDQALAMQASLMKTEKELRRQLETEQATVTNLTGELTTARKQRDSIEQDLASLRNQTASFRPVVAVLSPGLFRGEGDLTRIRVSSRALLVELRLDLGSDDYDAYQVSLESGAGKVLTVEKLKAETRAGKVVLPLALPARLLATGEYTARVSGVDQEAQTDFIDRYYFQILKD